LVTKGDHPTRGHCYIGAEAAFYALGGAAYWQPYVLTSKEWSAALEEGQTHWFIRHRTTGEVVDPTSAQFKGAIIPYDEGRACGFLTSKPSKRAAIVLKRVSC
jgi:hypothetical protein